MTQAPLTEQIFLACVSNHRMEVVADHGNIRHLRFAQPDSSDRSFEIVTWQNGLCFTGDMETFVFEHRAESVTDIFDLFRPEVESHHLHINPSLWHSKIVASTSPAKILLEESVRSNLSAKFDAWIFNRLLLLHKPTD